MNDSPHGASVVPTVAVTMAMVSPLIGHRRHQQTVGRGAPIGMRQHAGGDIGEKHRRYQQQQMLDAVETAAEHEQRDDQRGNGNADVSADSEELETCCYSGEFGAGRADVRDHECGEDRTAEPHAVALAHQPDEALAGDDTHPGRERVEHDQRDSGQQQHPQQLVTVVGSEHRVRGDACRVVVGQAGEQPGADHGQQRTDRKAAAPHRRASRGSVAAVRPDAGAQEVSAPQNRLAGEEASPMRRVVGGHDGDDFGRIGFGHRAQYPLADDRVDGANHLGGCRGTLCGEYLGGRLRVETGNEHRQAARVQQVHSRARHRKLHFVSAFGGQMQIAPSDGIAVRPGGQPAKAKAPQHRPETDFDADEFHPAIGASGEHHIGDAGHSLAGNIDDLRVENITHQQDFLGVQCVGHRADAELGAVCRQLEATGLDRHNCRPRHQQVVVRLAVHHDSIDECDICACGQADGHIRYPAAYMSVRAADVAADDPAEQQHVSSMP